MSAPLEEILPGTEVLARRSDALLLLTATPHLPRPGTLLYPDLEPVLSARHR